MPVPGGELDKPTDRNHWGWVFLKEPKIYFPKSKTLKNDLRNTVHFGKLKHHVIIMETHDY